MKQEEAKRSIIHLWDKRPENRQTTLDIYAFCEELKKTNPELFRFKYRKGSDVCQILKRWLIAYTSDQGGF